LIPVGFKPKFCIIVSLSFTLKTDSMKSFLFTIAVMLFCFGFAADVAQASPKEKLDTVIVTTCDVSQDFLAEMPVVYLYDALPEVSYEASSFPLSYAVTHGQEVFRIDKNRYRCTCPVNITKKYNERPYLNQFHAGIDPIKQC